VPDEEDYWYGVGEERHVTPTCLSQFIQLVERPTSRVLQFARQWGLLGLCDHGKPATHRLEDRDGRERSILLGYDGCTPAPAEPISIWRTYSERFRTIVQVAQRLHRGEQITDDAVWENMGRPLRSYVAGRSRHTVPYQRKRLARSVNLQLASSALQPIVRWDGGEPKITFGVFGAVRTSLLAALVMQLAMTVADTKIAICAFCHKTYRPSRRTHVGQTNYCVPCRKAGIDARIRVQRLRDRRRSEV
jgi:hypothetical protein